MTDPNDPFTMVMIFSSGLCTEWWCGESYSTTAEKVTQHIEDGHFVRFVEGR